MTKAEAILEAIQTGASDDELMVLDNTNEEEFKVSDGKCGNGFTWDNKLSTCVPIASVDGAKGEKHETTPPQMLITVGDEVLTLEEADRRRGEQDLSGWIRENNGEISYDKEYTINEIKVTGEYQDLVVRADELFEEELKGIYKVYEGKTIKSVDDLGYNHMDPRGNKSKIAKIKYGGLTEDEQHLMDNSSDPLTGIENVVNDNGDIIGVKRKGINVNGNSTVTSVEMRLAAIKIKDTLIAEDDYLSSMGDENNPTFAFKAIKNTEKELQDHTISLISNMDWTNPNAFENYQKAIKLKFEELMTKESLADETYQEKVGMINGIMLDKFESILINKMVEEEKSILMPDVTEGTSWFANAFSGLHKLVSLTLPSALANSTILVNGDRLHKINKNFEKANEENWNNETVGYIGWDGGGKNQLRFETSLRGVGSLVSAKKITWKEAEILLREDQNRLGTIVMEAMTKSKGYQNKLSVLGAPRILDENYKWDLDGKGYSELFGGQLGQMFLGTLTFGGSTFIQELGAMSQESIMLQSALLYANKSPFEYSKNIETGQYTEEIQQKIMEDYANLSAKEHQDLALQVLSEGLVDFDSLYSSAARSASLDLVGNFLVIGAGYKMVPKQMLNSFVSKQYGDFFRGASGLLKLAAGGTLAEVLTEGLQATNAELTVAHNAPLKNFNYNSVINEAGMGAIVPGPMIIASQSAQLIYKSIQDKKLAGNKDLVENWLMIAEKKLTQGRNKKKGEEGYITFKQYEKGHLELETIKNVLQNTNLKNVKNENSRQAIVNALLNSEQSKSKIKELNLQIDKDEKAGYGENSTNNQVTPLKKEIAIEQEKILRETEVVFQEKAIDSWLQNSQAQAQWQNTQTEGVHKNRNTKIFKTRKEAIKYITENHKDALGMVSDVLNGYEVINFETGEKEMVYSYGANIDMGDGSVLNVAITENVIAGIRKNDLRAGNVINHEQGHDNLSVFDESELLMWRQKTTKELAASKDPQMQYVYTLLQEKIQKYRNDPKVSLKTEHEEFFTALSDAFAVINMMDLSIDGSTTLSMLGNDIASLFDQNMGPIVDWKKGFDEQGVLQFIQSYTKEQRLEVKDVIAEIREGKEPGIFEEGVEKGKDGIYVKESRRVYPSGRTTEEVNSANSVLAKELIEQKANTYSQFESNPVLQKQVKDGEEKKLQGELVANNMGLINKFLLPKANGGYYFDKKAGDVKYDDFSEAVMGVVGDIINSYSPDKGDFGMYLGGVMDKRIPGIWDKLINEYEFAIDLDNRKDEESSDYGDFMANFEDEVITIGGEETTIRAVTSEMRKTLGIEKDDPLYSEVLDDVIEITIENFDAINEPGWYLDTQDRIRARLFKKIKSKLGTPGSKKYKDFLNNWIENIYNLLPQSVFNKSYDQFNDIVSERATVAQSEDKDVEFEKGVKVKSKTAGNRVAVKKPFTQEIGEQFIQNLLNPEKGRPASKQDGLVDAISGVIGFDAVSSAIDSKAFEEAHGTQQAVLGSIADKINRDMTVKFTHPVTGKIHEISDIKQLEDVGRLIRGVQTSGLINPKDTRQFIEELAKDLKIDNNVVALVIALDSKDIIEKGDAIRFKTDLMKSIEKTDPELYAELLEHGGIKGKKAVLDVMAEEITNFTKTLSVADMDAIDLSMFGFHQRIMNSAATQQGPKRGYDPEEEFAPLSGYGSNPKSKNLSYANKTTSLLVDGWTFNPKTNEFVNNKTKVRSIDPVKEFGAEPISADYYEASQGIIAEVEARRNDPNYVASEKWKDVRIMNVDYSGGLMKKISSILNDKKLDRQGRVDKILKNHGAEIKAANIANIELASHLSEKLVEAVRNGDMSKTTMIHMLQSQTNLAFGFRGLTKLEMISVLEGTYKSIGTGEFDKNGNEISARTYGEHINPNSGKMLGLAKIILQSSKDPKYNYKQAIAELWSTHDQIMFPSTDAKTIDTSKLLSGPTSTASYDRLKALTLEQQENFIGINGESYKEALARIIVTNNIRIETARIEFESDRKIENQNTVINEDLKKLITVKQSLSVDFNKIIESTGGIKAESIFSEAQGKIRGKSAGGLLDMLYPASAYDFEMFTYKYMGKGKDGEQQALFFKDNLFTPYEKAIQQIDKQKQEIRDDYKALVKELPKVRKNLKKKIKGTNYTVEQAIRVYTWAKNGMEIPGISKRDQNILVKTVEADESLILFSDRLSAISQQEGGYVKPSEYWTVEGISYDLTEMTGTVGRAKTLAPWKQNIEQIFSEENKNKLRATYGNNHVEALEDMLYRMEYGRNQSRPGRIEQNWNNWVNNSVGAVMFFNMRSAALQTISAVNYIDWENNNPANAALAFANQPQYWKDFSYIFNSDYLKERRSGNKRTINEAELSAAIGGSKNKAKAALAWLLEKGFLPTQIADSFAIASGGASYYRNQVKVYEKQGMSTKEAERQAFLDFRVKTEKGQQSSRPDLISQQQAGGLGRLILAFKNTPMQYNRQMIKAIADIKNKRGDLKSNLSKVAYYGAVQNVIFASLQTALFSALGDEDEWDTKKERVANSMIDSILNGMGLTGAVAVTIKNGYLRYTKEKERGFKADHTRTIIEFANLSPTIGSKLRKLYSGIQTEAMNEGSIEEMGLTIENPAFSALANVVSATTNIPADRVVRKINNIILASSSETEAMDRIALLMGWNAWDLGIKSTKAKEINKKVKKRKKEEKVKLKKKETAINETIEEDKNIQKQKIEKKEGKKVTCSYNTNKGRCGMAVIEGDTRCTVHQVVEQREDGKQTQCKKIKSNKQRCGVMTTNKSGFCYYHD